MPRDTMFGWGIPGGVAARSNMPIFSLFARCQSWRCAMDFIHELLVEDNSSIIGIRSLPATMLTLNFQTTPASTRCAGPGGD